MNSPLKKGVAITTYSIKSRIGSGGFGEVFEALRDQDGAVVALKYLRDVDPDSLARFGREVRCLEKLSHPNIVAVLGKNLNTDPYYYVMPLYDHSLLAEFPSIVGNDTRIQSVFKSVLDAILFAHSQGVLHRDLKPENVLISKEDLVVVNDFGLGRIITSASTRLTITGFGMGTPFYCAPEQMVDAKNADERSDIYSLGRILYDLFGGLDSAVIELDDVPPPIAAVIRKATRRNPKDRYQTVTSLSDAFAVAMEVLLGQIGPDSLEALLEQTDASTSADSPKLASLQAALSRVADDGELVHELIMKVSPEVFSLLTTADPDLMRRVASRFATFEASQVWGFSYTDAIGLAVEALFFSVKDAVVRANLLRAVLRVGTNHNRWEVMRRFATMLESIETNDEALHIWTELESEKSALEHVAGYVDKGKIRPLLINLFPQPV
jgi:eukaryotic-like serine/threonine-protein kinase